MSARKTKHTAVSYRNISLCSRDEESVLTVSVPASRTLITLYDVYDVRLTTEKTNCGKHDNIFVLCSVCLW